MEIELNRKLNLNFKNLDLLKTALTHRSYLNESNEKNRENNERLEFLGDAVLEIIVSEYLFNKYPNSAEGELTSYRSAVVRMESLADIALDLSLGDYIYMSKGEEQTGGRQRPYILANTFEALLGAIFLDQEIEACKKFLFSVFFDKIDKIINDKGYIDAKSSLQELTQEKYKKMPVYRLVSQKGPDHDKTFVVEVLLKNEVLAKGSGKSKQQAQQDAAKNALEKLK